MKKIILVLLFISLVFYVSKNKSDINFESMEASENRVNDPCANADCTPDEFNSPYYKIPYEKLRDLEFLNYGDFGVVLLNNGILNSEVLKEYNFKDKDNSNYIAFENEAMLTINPNPSNGKVKSIDYDFSMCSSISSIDIDRIRKILKIFKNHNLENSFLRFDFIKKMKII